MHVVGDILFALLGACLLVAAFTSGTFYYGRSSGRADRRPAPRWLGRTLFIFVGSVLMVMALWDLLHARGQLWRR
jgi:hypothetical protein